MRPRFFNVGCGLLVAALSLAHCLSYAAEVRRDYSASTLALPAPEAPVILVINGNIARTNAPGAAHIDHAMLRSLPTFMLQTHTVVTDGLQQFNGPLMRDLLEWVGAQGSTVEAVALNNYTIDIPISDFQNYDVMLATHMNGHPLPRHTKGPIWLVYPRDQHRQLQDIRYDYRWVWQLRQLTVK